MKTQPETLTCWSTAHSYDTRNRNNLDLEYTILSARIVLNTLE